MQNRAQIIFEAAVARAGGILVRLYEDRELAEPGQGFGAKADDWRARVAALPPP